MKFWNDLLQREIQLKYLYLHSVHMKVFHLSPDVNSSWTVTALLFEDLFLLERQIDTQRRRGRKILHPLVQ